MDRIYRLWITFRCVEEVFHIRTHSVLWTNGCTLQTSELNGKTPMVVCVRAITLRETTGHYIRISTRYSCVSWGYTSAALQHYHTRVMCQCGVSMVPKQKTANTSSCTGEGGGRPRPMVFSSLCQSSPGIPQWNLCHQSFWHHPSLSLDLISKILAQTQL